MTEVWYYEYIVKIWDEIDNKEVIHSGVVPADSMAEAMKELEEYYDEELMEVQMLKAITEGMVFEFQLGNDCEDFDYTITRKM